MLRRNARLRREYLHRKGLEGQERAVYDKKRKVKEALEAGKPIPTELRNEGRQLKAQIQLDDAKTEGTCAAAITAETHARILARASVARISLLSSSPSFLLSLH